MFINKLFVFFLLAATIAIVSAQSPVTFDNAISGNQTPTIDSRFFNFGGVIKELFNGFDQLTSGRKPGGPNSQFYPDGFAQNYNYQPSYGFGNRYPNFNQGIIQGNPFGGSQRQQQALPFPGSLNFNPQPVQNQGQLSQQTQGLSPILNMLNNNSLQSTMDPNSRFQRSETTTIPWTFQNSNVRGEKNGQSRPQYQGTLDDFFTDQLPPVGNGSGLNNNDNNLSKNNNGLNNNGNRLNNNGSNLNNNNGLIGNGSSLNNNNGLNNGLNNNGNSFNNLANNFNNNANNFNNKGNGNNQFIFPGSYNMKEPDQTTTIAAIWGHKVVVPTTTVSSDRIVFIDDTETPYQKQCVQSCRTTSEYKPVCGSDGVTYFNPGRLVCARNCGINVHQRWKGSCNSKSGK